MQVIVRCAAEPGVAIVWDSAPSAVHRSGRRIAGVNYVYATSHRQRARSKRPVAPTVTLTDLIDACWDVWGSEDRHVGASSTLLLAYSTTGGLRTRWIGGERPPSRRWVEPG